MSRDGSGSNDQGDEGPDRVEEVQTEEEWPPFEQEDPGAQSGWNLEERQQELERKEDILKNKEGELRDRERKLNKKEREMEQREQEVLDRREEIVDERDRLEEKEQELTGKEQEIDEKTAKLDGREQEIQSLKDDIMEAVSQSGSDGGPVFSNRPRRAASVLLGLLGVVGFLGAPLVLMLGGSLPALTSAIEPFASLPQPFTSSFATGLAVVMVVGGLVEILGGYFAASGKFWMFSIAASIIGMMLYFPVGLSFLIAPGNNLLPGVISMVLLLPIGLTAVIFLTIGESQFA